MNQKIAGWASLVNVVSVLCFAIFMLSSWWVGCYFFSMFIAFSFVVMISGFCAECKKERLAAGYSAVIFSGIYAVIVLLVYFAQLTAVQPGTLNDQARQIIDFQHLGLFFSYDLLGYAVMALSTFFAGLTLSPRRKMDRWLKGLLLIHGIFFFSCLIFPLLGVSSAGMENSKWIGVAILEVWCLYFLPVGLLSFVHFQHERENK